MLWLSLFHFHLVPGGGFAVADSVLDVRSTESICGDILHAKSLYSFFILIRCQDQSMSSLLVVILGRPAVHQEPGRSAALQRDRGCTPGVLVGVRQFFAGFSLNAGAFPRSE